MGDDALITLLSLRISLPHLPIVRSCSYLQRFLNSFWRSSTSSISETNLFHRHLYFSSCFTPATMAADLYALFSNDSFRCLDFDDVTSLDKAQRQAVVGIMNKAFPTFLNALGYQHVDRPKDTAFRNDFFAWGHKELVNVWPDNGRLESLLNTTASSMEHFYPSSSHQFRMCIGSATAYTTSWTTS